MKYLIITMLLHIFLTANVIGQPGGQERNSDVAARAKADTSRFTVNKAEGWSLYNSYLEAAGKDSTLLEVTFQHDRNLNWEEYQYFGRIKDRSLLPARPQEVEYLLLTDVYMLKIETNGNCFIRLAGGELPPRDPVVLPIRIIFERI